MKERLVNFLRTGNWGPKCEVKVGEMVSDSFGVMIMNGLRQECDILSPVLFSLYINTLVI